MDLYDVGDVGLVVVTKMIILHLSSEDNFVVLKAWVALFTSQRNLKNVMMHTEVFLLMYWVYLFCPNIESI